MTKVTLTPNTIQLLREIAHTAESQGAVPFLKVARLSGYLEAGLDAVSDAESTRK